jgi:beta-lactamase regulating signal transducer with metallopeptidase domain
MMLTIIGWAVVHSLWQGAFIAGLAALTLGLLRDRTAGARYLIGCTSLGLMAIMPLATCFADLRIVRTSVRPRMMDMIGGMVGFPAIVWWGSVIVPIVGGVWMVGLCISLVRIGREGRRARWLRRRDLGDAGNEVRGIVADLRQQMPLARPVDVRSSARAEVPMVLGWRRPVILLPDGTADRLQPSQLRAVLAHELAHVRRGDYVANLLQMAAETLLFHHPGARWLSRCIRAEREYSCDDAAVGVGRDPGDYAHALATLEDARVDCRLAVSAGTGTLLDRLQRIIGHPRPVLTPARGAVVLVAASAIGAAILALAMSVPPSLPFGAQVRRRTPPGQIAGPPGTVTPPVGNASPRTR